MKRKILTILCLVFALITTMAIFAACAKEPNGEVGEEVGEYYCEVEGEEYTLTLSEKSQFTLVMGSDPRKGSYTLEGSELLLTFKKGDPNTAAATLSDDAIMLVDYEGASYQFLKKVNYTIKFETDGNGTIDDAIILNGKTVQKPQDPQKTGATFITWYTDSKFTSAYDFTQPVRGNFTLYARFVDQLNPEFKVHFELNGGEGQIADRDTVGGMLFDLPTPTKSGATFAGWWVSQYDLVEKPSYAYKAETVLDQNTTLVAMWNGTAPLVSITPSGIEWTAGGVNNNYTVKFSGPNGVIYEDSQGQKNYSYNFSDADMGDYVAEVTLNGVTGYAYYKNKALARVSAFDVTEDVLQWNPIENAQSYLLSYDCGTEGHHHADIPCTEPKYSFADCDMPEKGMSFTVKAVAEGYMQSESKSYLLNRTLDQVSALTVDPASESVSWDAVEKAASYIVDVKKNGVSIAGYPKNVGEALSVSLKTVLRGEYTVEVTPVAKTWNSPAASTQTFTKTRIATPGNIRLEGLMVRWDAVDGATDYEVTFNGKSYPTTNGETAFELTDEMYVAGQNAYVFTIIAKAENAGESSLVSDNFTIQSGVMGDVSYANGTLSWDAVWGAKGYYVKIGEAGEEEFVYQTSFAPTYTKKGSTVIYVCAVYEEQGKEVKTNWASHEEMIYAVEFDVAQGENAVASLYKAYGDPITLTKAEDMVRRGYTFNGWYTGAEDDGRLYNDASFAEHSDLTLFAHWDPLSFTITLEVGTYGEPLEKNTIEVYYDQMYELPVPKAADPVKAFYGWSVSQDGTGMLRTDYTGKSISSWGQLAGATLYAAWRDVFKFDKTTISAKSGWAVSYGPGIDYVTEVTIPVTYQTLPVLVVESFSSCKKLQTINIPETIREISLQMGATAFNRCESLKAVNVYSVTSVDGAHDDAIYSSHEGVLYAKNERTGGKDLVFYPFAKAGAYTVEDGTTTIASGAFYQNSVKIESISFPASVTLIEAQAFSIASSLTKVTFLPAKEGEKLLPLEIRGNAFEKCTKLDTFTFPSRLAKLPEDPETHKLNFAPDSKKIMNVNIDNTDAYKDQIYSSVEGLLCKKLENGGNEFIYLPSGRSGDIEIPVGVTSIGQAVMKDKGSILDNAITGIVIPGYVTNIGEEAFCNCFQLKTVTFLGDEKSQPLTIGRRAFYSCTSLNASEIVLPANLVKIGAQAFGGIGSSANMLTVRMESGAIGQDLDFEDDVFANEDGVSYVKTVIIGDHAKFVDLSGVFGDNLNEVIVSENHPEYSSRDGVLFDKGFTRVVFFPKGRLGDWTTPDEVTSISANLFAGSEDLQKITLGKNVVNIGSNAFKDCKLLTQVTFVDGGTADLVIGDGAFAGCTKLTQIDLPERTTELGAGAFTGCKLLESVKIPSSMKKMGDPSTKVFDLFDGCTALQTINVTDGSAYASDDGILYSVQEGEKFALLYAPIGKTGIVTLPSTVQEIWKNAFLNNAGLSEFKSAERKTVQNDQGKQVPLPLTIAEQAFSGCTGLTKVTLPQGLSEIGTRVFENCGLESVVIPNTVAIIHTLAFKGCSKLTSVTFEEGNPDVPLVLEDGEGYVNYYTESGKSATAPGAAGHGVFDGCTLLTKIELPERTRKIGISAFAGTGLTAVTLPASLEEIGGGAFFNLSELKTVTFKKGEKGETKLRTIGQGAFYKTAIEEIDLPDTVTALEMYAFYGTKLTSIELPANLITLGTGLGFQYSSKIDGSWNYEGYVFAECKSLTHVTFGNNIQYIGSYTFSNAPITGDVTLPGALLEVERYTFGSKNSTITSLTFPDNTPLHLIRQNAFRDLTAMTSFSFGKNTGDDLIILEYAFAGSKVTSLVLPANVKAISYEAFINMSELQTVKWETDDENKEKVTSLTYFGNYENAAPSSSYIDGIFSGTKIESFNFPETTAEQIFVLGPVFGKTARLKQVYLSKGIKSLGSMFNGLPSLETVVVAQDHPAFSTKDGEQAIYDQAGNNILLVYGALKETTITVQEGSIQIGDSAYFRQAAVTKLVLPQSVEQIGESAFAQCYSLEEVVIPKGSRLTTIGAGAFLGCSRLKNIDFSNATNLINLGTTAYVYSAYGPFESCLSLTSVDLTATKIKRLGDSAFKNCYALETLKLPDTITQIGYYALQSAGIKYLKLPKELPDFLYGNSTSTWTISGAIKSTIETIDFAGNEKLTSFPSSMFKGCVNLKTIYSAPDDGKHTAERVENVVTLPVNMSAIGSETFSGCTSIVKVDFSGCKSLDRFGTTSPTGTVKLSTGSQTFRYCTALEEVVLPTDFVYVGQYAFSGCTSLRTLWYGTDSEARQEGVAIFPKDIRLANYSFEQTAFTKAILPELVYDDSDETGEVGKNVFQNSPALAEVELDNGVTGLGQYMFRNCTELQKIGVKGDNGISDVMPSGLEYIGQYCFSDCSSLTSIDFSGCTQLKLFNSTTSTTKPTATTKVYTFDGCTNLTTVKLPNGFETIPGNTFNDCTSLTTVTGLETVTLIGTYAFANTAITEANISSVAGTLGSYAFYNASKLATLTFGAENMDLTTIDSSAFEGCLLTTVNGQIPQSVTTIKSKAFAYTKIKNVILPAKLTSLSADAFVGCYDIETFAAGLQVKYTVVDKGVIKSGSTLTFVLAKLYGTTSTDGKKLTIPYLNAELPANVFDGLTGFTTVELATGYTKVPNYAFANSSVTSVILPDTITEFGDHAFDGSAITSISIGSKVKKIGTYAFANTTALTQVEIPETVTSVGNYAFSNSALQSITLQSGSALNSATNLFQNCEVLTSVTFPTAGLTKIGNYWFDGCTKLTNVAIPDTVTTIGDYAFQSTGLTTVTLGEKLTSVGKYAFASTSLTSVTIKAAKAINSKEGVFSSNQSLGTVTFEGKSDGFTTLGKNAFLDCMKLTAIELPATVTSIGESAFQGAGLTGFTIPEKVTTIGKNAFLQSKLQKISIPVSVTTINAGAFADIATLTTVTFESADAKAEGSVKALKFGDGPSKPETVSSWGVFESSGVQSVNLPIRATTLTASLFRHCTKLTAITIPETVVKIAECAFLDTGITKLELPKACVTVSAYAFQDSALESIKFSEDMDGIGNYAFYNTKLKSVSIPTWLGGTAGKTVKPSLGSYCFAECRELASVTFENGEKRDSLASSNMFENCTALTSFTLPSGLTGIKTYSFSGCTNIKAIWIPKTACSAYNSIGEYAFFGWTSEQTIYMEYSAFDYPRAWEAKNKADWIGRTQAKIVWGISQEEFETLTKEI